MEYWNPWRGCHKISEGCLNCYMYEQDKQFRMESNKVVKTNKFDLPLKKTRAGGMKIPEGSIVGVCFTSDFFIEEADAWRDDAWKLIAYRDDCTFLIITKRAERIKEHLPSDWGEGYKNVIISVTGENQARLDERIPILLEVPMLYRGITIAPMLEEVTIQTYLDTGKIFSVAVGGESCPKMARECHFEWVSKVKDECEISRTNFAYHQTGTNLIVKGKQHWIPRDKEKEQAKKANLDVTFTKVVMSQLSVEEFVGEF